MRFTCPFCYYVVTADDASRGYRVQCSSCGKSILVPSARFEEGCVVGDFIIKSKLGEGSIGAVYRATQISLDRQVALKILSPEYTTQKGVKDFLREARAAAKLSHPNLVQSYAVGEDEGTCYMAMTYISGETVKARLKREGRIPVDEALHIVQQVAEALFYAWDEIHMIHRDVKPDNIMITEDGLVKLTDLGLAMNQAEWTEDMEISGSPSYMSPEQFSGDKLDTRSDIYSLGITLYQMISGVLPFDASTIKSIAKQHFESEAIPLNKRDALIPQKVAQLVKKMIAKLPEDRFQDMEALLNEIWTIRQRTAPNKSLVPDVHTISIKRLDYEIQHEAVEADKNAKKLEQQIKSRYDAIKLAVIVIPLLLIGGVILAFALGKREQTIESELSSKVESYERFVQDKSLPLDTRLTEGQAILDAYSTPRNPSQKYLRTKVELMMADLRLQEQQTQNLTINQEKTLLASDLLRVKSMLAEKQANLQQMKANLPGAMSAESLRTEFEALQKENKKLKAELESVALQDNSSQKTLDKLRGVLSDEWQKDVLNRINSMRKAFRFSDIDVLLTIEQVRNPDEKKLLTRLERNNARYAKIYSEITDSGTKYASAPIFAESKIVMIANGYIDYLDPKGKIRQKHWNEIPTQNFADVIAKDLKNTASENEIRSAIELFKGNYGMALKFNPKDQELRDLLDTLYNEAFYQIKCAVPVDRKRAESMASQLLKQVDGVENYDSIKHDLRVLVKREAAESN